MVEIAIIGSDMQEVIGTATAIKILSSKVSTYSQVLNKLTSSFIDPKGGGRS